MTAEQIRVGVIGTGFVARHFVYELARRPHRYALGRVLTRRPPDGCPEFPRPDALTRDPDALIEASDVVFECSGDPLHAAGAVGRALAAAAGPPERGRGRPGRRRMGGGDHPNATAEPVSPMDVRSTAIPEVKLITPRRFGDHRGFFSEVYNRRALAEAGIDVDFVQDNHSHSAQAGTLRGLHFQSPPCAQTKLVRVLRGAVVDVAVDLRRGSPTFGRHVMVELSAENGTQILIPQGFAHGILTLLPDTELAYKVDAYYSPAHDLGVRWDDPDLAIPWPLPPGVVLSEKDRKQPLLADLPDYFGYR